MIITNINVKKIKNHFFVLNQKQRKKREIYIELNKKDKNHKIKHYDFLSINEIKITLQIKKIPCYFIFYNLIEGYKFVKQRENNSIDYKNKNDINDKNDKNDKNDINDINDKKLILLQYNNKLDHNITETKNIYDYLINSSTIRQFIFNTLFLHETLLVRLIELNDNNICFLNLNVEHIFIDNNNLMLDDFSNSIIISEIKNCDNDSNINYIKNIVNGLNDYACKPLEIHILFYLFNNNIKTLSYTYIIEIVENYIENFTILTLLPKEFGDEYEKKCIETLMKYINKPLNIIINHILKGYNTWDNFSLSVILIHVYCCLKNTNELNDTPPITDLINYLCKNIDPNFSKRESLNESFEKFKIVKYAQWDFVKNLNENNLNKLFEMLSL